MAENLTKRSGWITFAGLAALIAGAYNALSGIAALSDDDTLAAQAQEVLYGIDLTAWGWFWLIVGLVQLLTGVLILQRNMWGLWLGVGIASLSALMTVLVMFVFPLWAIAVLTIDFLVLFALLTESEGFTAWRIGRAADGDEDERAASGNGDACRVESRVLAAA